MAIVYSALGYGFLHGYCLGRGTASGILDTTSHLVKPVQPAPTYDAALKDVSPKPHRTQPKANEFSNPRRMARPR